MGISQITLDIRMSVRPICPPRPEIGVPLHIFSKIFLSETQNFSIMHSYTWYYT